MRDSQIIYTEQLTKYYGRIAGVKEISFEVNRGEIFGFLGPNGAGKTTTIRLLLDLLRPTSGKIVIFGKDVKSNSFEIRQKCGYLPGNFSAYGNLTGKEFLNLLADLRKVPRYIEPGLLDRFGLANGDLKRKIKHLSHGTLQKLGIIQAFFHRPELLILDEPTTGLDPLMQEEFYDLLHKYQNMGCTTFFSSHNLSEVEKVCHRLAIIRKGEIVAIESIEDMKKKLYRKLELTLRKPLDRFELPGARIIKKQGLKYEFIVTGRKDTLLKSLADLPLEDFVFPRPDLEEVFMNYYRDQRDD
ncbi:MAG: ABC transporter ATP-binding protein [Bacteroidetes bacterium]|nr:ABC transporter ATP-binding protein [Bacteroidota bacterium]MBL7103258.1 ABC transporter ATP-binding protein [Bacteroidales bacterium]